MLRDGRIVKTKLTKLWAVTVERENIFPHSLAWDTKRSYFFANITLNHLDQWKPTTNLAPPSNWATKIYLRATTRLEWQSSLFSLQLKRSDPLLATLHIIHNNLVYPGLSNFVWNSIVLVYGKFKNSEICRDLSLQLNYNLLLHYTKHKFHSSILNSYRE